MTNIEQKIRFLRYSTDDLPPEERHDAYANQSWSRLFALRPLSPFYVETDAARFGRIAVSYADIGGQEWVRDEGRLKKAEADSLAVNISLNIVAQGRAGDRDFKQLFGNAFLCDLSQISSHRSTSGRCINLVIPRALLVEEGVDVGGLHGLVLSSAATQMLTSHMLHLREVAWQIDVSEAPRIERSILDILVLAIRATNGSRAASLQIARSTMMERACAEIEKNLGSSLLTASYLCRSLDISRSTLHRMFGEYGGVQAYIRNQRLDLARLALLAPAETRIVDIAERFGFSDAAHFSRSFRERFGETPSDYRRQPEEAAKP